jgi:hypothetical protein
VKTKKKSVHLIIGIIVLLLVVFASILYIGAIFWIGIQEDNDFALIDHERSIAKQLDEYKKSHGSFPATLQEANINNKACVTLSCKTVKYKVSEDKNSFTLAAENNGFIAYFNWNDELIKKYGIDSANGYIAGLAITEELSKKRNDFPVYKKSPGTFATPSAWPDLED